MEAPTRGSPKRITVPLLLQKAAQDEKIICLTAYDYTMARLIDHAGTDLILVGDSLSAIVQGHKTTIPVTMEEMVYHCRCVTRGVQRALVVGDLPFMSYQVSKEQALQNAGRLLKEGDVGAVKLEGGVTMAETIRAIVRAEIPVMGHVGLTPQAYHRMGGHKVQGKQGGRKKPGSREQVLDDARAVEDAGAFAVVLEGIPCELAAEITERLEIPTIGIGAGASCNGQILVTHDMLGMVEGNSPRFVKRFATIGAAITEAIQEYGNEVRTGAFPATQHTYGG